MIGPDLLVIAIMAVAVLATLTMIVISMRERRSHATYDESAPNSYRPKHKRLRAVGRATDGPPAIRRKADFTKSTGAARMRKKYRD